MEIQMRFRQQCEQAQQAWIQDLLKLPEVRDDPEKLYAQAQMFVRAYYAYQEVNKTVLFKPTLAEAIPQRNSEQGAISYFIGGDKRYPEDIGFALMGWESATFDNLAWSFFDDVVYVAGQLALKHRDGSKITADYTMAYVCCSDGKWRLLIHHSSANSKA
jgi:hypothetical protein